MHSIYNRKKKPYDVILSALIYLSAAFAVILLIGILLYVFFKGSGVIGWKFLTTQPSAIAGTFGIAGNIVNTLYVVIITILIATPVGIGSAIYLNEYAKPGRLVSLIEFTTETLSGIPSIIFGLFGMIFFGRICRLSYSILTGGLTMTLMVLPLITRNTEEALKSVPESYRTGALGMGTTKWHMIRTILLPSAMPGIITGIILAIGRIVGESAALMFRAGRGYLLPKTAAGFLQKILQPGGTMTVQLYLCMSKAQYDEAFGIAAVLLVIVFMINLTTKYLSKRFDVNSIS